MKLREPREAGELPGSRWANSLKNNVHGETEDLFVAIESVHIRICIIIVLVCI